MVYKTLFCFQLLFKIEKLNWKVSEARVSVQAPDVKCCVGGRKCQNSYGKVISITKQTLYEAFVHDSMSIFLLFLFSAGANNVLSRTDSPFLLKSHRSDDKKLDTMLDTMLGMAHSSAK